jgi:3'-phosphoadenosine 5'-phosphosulfate sulfotransferase (PAPS reductase)/FAD synthetase
VTGNAYFITGPALISFSGGRTSGYMLRMILDAHSGKLPDDVHVTFANTGKEREETLRFVHECGSRWGVYVNWLERDGKDAFQAVGFNSASRSGEPFAALIAEQGYLPNVANPWCSIALKQRVARQFARTVFGDGRYFSVVGLRYDERGRRDNALSRAFKKKDSWTPLCPLYTARVTQKDVRAWWRKQDFDLGLHGFEGNCDGCFQKSARLYEVERYSPGSLDWWIEQERLVADTAEHDARHWILGRSYGEIRDAIARQPDMFLNAFDNDPDEDAECGLGCGLAA